MRRSMVLILSGLVLLMTALFAAPVAGVTEHCPGQPGDDPNKVESVNPGDLDDVILDAGTLVCIKAGTEATGIVEADGEESLCDILIEAGILDGSGESCRNVSYYVTYESVPTPTPSPSETQPTPSASVPAPSPSEALPSDSPTGNVDFPTPTPAPVAPVPNTATELPVQGVSILIGGLLVALGTLFLANWYTARKRG